MMILSHPPPRPVSVYRNWPDHCSGLQVARYDTEDLERLLDGFTVVESTREEHITPGGAGQPFTWIAARRRSNAST